MSKKAASSGSFVDHRRRLLYCMLKAKKEPMCIKELASAFKVHPNTMRMDLDQLKAASLIEEIKDDSGDHGRPKMLFQAQIREDFIANQSYPQLSTRLLSWISQLDQNMPGRNLFMWGKRLGQQAAMTACEHTEVVTALAALGFDPSQKGETVHLGKCPFGEQAADYRLIVCNLDMGFLQSYLSTLFPFFRTRMRIGTQGCQLILEKDTVFDLGLFDSQLLNS